MKRREFITLLGGAAAWPLTAHAQQARKLPTIGLLVSGTPATHGQWFAASVQRLRELGWIEGRTVMVEHRWAEGRDERFAEIMAEFVQMKVDVIVTTGATLLPAKQVTSVIPIVFAIAADPVGSGLVASLARPGGNVTGLSLQQGDVAGKRLQMLREILPGLRRLAIMANVGSPGAAIEVREAETAARTFSLETVALEMRREKISRRPSRRSRAWRRHFTSWATRSWSPIGCGSIYRPSPRDYRRIAISGSSSKREV